MLVAGVRGRSYCGEKGKIFEIAMLAGHCFV